MPSPNFSPNELNERKIQPENQKIPEAPLYTPESRIEVPPTPETQHETKQKIEIKKEGFLDDAIENLKSTLKRTKKKPAQIPQVRDEITIKVEKILEEGIHDAYMELTPIQQQEFKIKGEKTANEIRLQLQSKKTNVKKIFKLILEWLKMLPGVNKFFLEQEAKIKADKIISLKKFNNK